MNDCIWNFDEEKTLILELQKKIMETFTINDETATKGRATILFLFNHAKDIYELRVLLGLTPAFNKKLIKALKIIEKDSDIPTPMNMANSTLLTTFSFSIYK